jgi:hypothetical protein
MSEGLLPPYGEASGPPVEDAEVVRAFARGEQAGHSERLHVEGSVLVAGFDLALGMRLAPGSVLVRVDLPQAMADLKGIVEAGLAAEGMQRLDEQTLLATPVAVQWLALRGSTWDLWGEDIDEAFAALRSAAVSDPFGSPINE